jgi:hypothetical protein
MGNFMFSNFLPENRTLYEIMCKKYHIAGQATDDSTIRWRHFACCITKAIGTQSEYVIFLSFPRQQ